jgi:hypothetical protein
LTAEGQAEGALVSPQWLDRVVFSKKKKKKRKKRNGVKKDWGEEKTSSNGPSATAFEISFLLCKLMS